VARCWAEELQLPLAVITPTSNFAHLGGDSLAVLRVSLRLDALLHPPATSSSDPEGSGSSHSSWGLHLGKLAPALLAKCRDLRALAQYLHNEVLSEGSDQMVESDSSALVSNPLSPDEEDVEMGDRLRFLYEATSFKLLTLSRYLLQSRNSDSASQYDTHLLQIYQDRRLKNPLHIAAFNGALPLVQLFLEEAGGLLGWRDGSGATVLHAAMHGTNGELVRYLLENARGIFHAVDLDQQSILHHAARFGAPLAVFRMIRETEAKLKTSHLNRAARPMIQWVDRWQRTPLHWASLNGFPAVVMELLSFPGVDTSLTDLDQETALDIAERRARCGAAEREGAGRPSTWSGIAKILGGSGTTEAVKLRVKKESQLKHKNIK
jgi:hypothetical protein